MRLKHTADSLICAYRIRICELLIESIVQCFKIKDKIEDHAAPPIGADLFVERVSLTGLLTFLFSIFYLQWAINRYVVPAEK
jgi:hypothetical protein